MASNNDGSVNGTDAELRAIEILQQATSPTNREAQSPGAQPQPTQALSPQGYTSIASQATRAVAEGLRQEHGAVGEEDHIHPDLRARPIMPAANNIAPAAPMMTTPIQPSAIPTTDAMSHAPEVSNPAPAPHPGGEDASSARKGKRELSNSKRAAQNRAAQRAFRRRKEEYIKKLEEKVGDAKRYEEAYHIVANQNTGLREYALRLQSELVKAGVKIPELPAGISLTQPPSLPAAPAAPVPPVVSQPESLAHPSQEPGLAAIAQAVVNAPGQGQLLTAMQEDTQTDEEVSQQLRTDGLP